MIINNNRISDTAKNNSQQTQDKKVVYFVFGVILSLFSVIRALFADYHHSTSFSDAIGYSFVSFFSGVLGVIFLIVALVYHTRDHGPRLAKVTFKFVGLVFFILIAVWLIVLLLLP